MRFTPHVVEAAGSALRATHRRVTARDALLVSGWIVIAAALIVPRAVALTQSLWHDEIYTIQHYISGGPSAILGPHGTNDHVLFSLLGWLTVYVPHGPEALYRAWGAVPFIAGAVALAVWLRARVETSVAALFLVFSAASPLLLHLTSEARGYGLAYLAMALLLISAYEGATGRQSFWMVVFGAAVVVGTWTLPTFILPALGAAGALFVVAPRTRRALLISCTVAILAVAAWYAPALDALVRSTGQEYGAPLPWHAPLTGPFRLFAAAFLQGLGTASAPMRALIVVIVMPLLVAGLVEARRRIPEFMAPSIAAVLVTLGVLALSGVFVEDRFLSYLLAPVFVFAALGGNALLRIGKTPFVRVAARAYGGTLVASAVAIFLVVAGPAVRTPFEDNRGAAEVIAAAAAEGRPLVLVNTHAPDDLRYYLPAPIQLVRPAHDDLQQRLCAVRDQTVIFVEQPFLVRPVDTACLSGRGAVHRRIVQRDRGGEINVWVVPPAAARP
jgi:hypothetical protein